MRPARRWRRCSRPRPSPPPEIPFVSFESEGVILVYGRDEQCHRGRQPAQGPSRRHRPDQAARRRDAAARHRVSGGARHASAPPRAISAPSSSRSTTMRSRRRHRAARSPSAPPRNGAVSHCDIVLDLSGGAPLFPAADLRDGYLRADPGDPGRGAASAVLKARDLIGTFDKPRYITFTEDLCAHSRSQIVGCTPLPRSLPDRRDRAGRRSCGDRRADLRRLRPMRRRLPDRRRRLCAAARRCADAQAAHAAHRLSRGRRHAADRAAARRRPWRAADRRARALRRRAAGQRAAARRQRGDAGRARSRRGGFRLRRVGSALAAAREAAPRHHRPGARPLALAEPILAGPRLRRRPRRDDRDRRSGCAGRDAARHRAAQPRAAPGELRGRGRQARRDAACACANCSAPRRRRSTSCRCPQGAPFGAVEINVEGCTLCLACVSACPTGALLDDPERPMLRFAEDACVQCGLCKATCPEKVITLQPQLDFRAATASARVLKEEEPFHCIRCGKPFGVKSTIERVAAKLEGKHWMFQNSAQRLDVIKMCEDCRVDRDDRAGVRSLRRPAASERAHHRGLSARARGAGAGE